MEHQELLTSVHLAWGIDLCLGLFAAAEAREHLEAALTVAQERGALLHTFLARARLVTACILQDDLTRAQELLDAVVPSDWPDFSGMTFPLRSCWAARAELDLALGQPAQALEIIDRLLAATANLEQYGPQAVPRLSQLRGQALAALGRNEEALVEFQGALIVAGARGEQPMVWRLHADLGHAYRALRRREAAEQNFSSARVIIQQLAATVPDDALREHFLEQALASLPAAPAPTPRQAASQAFGGLTERERQVAELIAQGKSNREIAAALSITVRTVEAHITRSLDKLGLKSRAAIAAWMVARGLAQPRR